MFHFPRENLPFSMKVLAGACPVFAPHSTTFARIPTFSQHPSPPPFSFLANLLSSPSFSFIPPFFLIHKQKSTSMAACIHSSKANPLSYDPNGSQTDNTSCNMLKFHRSNFPDSSSCIPIPICQNLSRGLSTCGIMEEINRDDDDVDLWLEIQEEARFDVRQEPILSNYYCNSIFSHKSLESALANHLAIKLGNSSLPSNTLYDLFLGEFSKDKEILKAAKYDLRAVKERDPACISFVQSLLNFKGFLACQAHRVAHKLWSQGRKVLALLIQNRVSEVFAVDIHPGAKIGRGILLDHATGVVVGETAVIGNNVSILHNVTLGGTGKASGDRHPKIGDGVLIGAGTCILGNIKIGEGAKIGAGSVVLKEIPPRTTAVGNPARLVGGKENPLKLDKMPSFTMDHTSHITEWSDYVI